MSMSRSTNDWAGQRVSQGRYHVRAQLGEGGMAFVYRALDKNLDADVVIKVPRRAILDDPEFATRFAREVRSLVKLSHPNIVKITDVGEHDGVPFAVMQYLSGGSLEDYETLDRTDPAVRSSLSALGDWLPGIARALDFVHSQGYVHRDVKPGNILFDAHGHVFLSDFGVAKVMADGADSPARRGQTAVTGAGLVCGTPEYMAPELIMAEPFDGRIDQYALAVTVYQMLAGRRPFEANSPTACLVLQTTREAPPLSLVEPRIPRGVSEAVVRALSKDPGRRFLTCAAFADAVVKSAASPHSRPTGRSARSDQVRLECPSCSKHLIFPAALIADHERARLKRFTCPSCQAHLRVSEAGGALVVAKESSTQVVAPRQATQKMASPSHPTQKLAAQTDATVRIARPPASSTIRQVPPSPTPVEGTPVAEKKAVPAVAIAAAGFLTLMAATILVAAVIVPQWNAPKAGRVHIDTSAVPAGAIFSLDGQPLDPSQLSKPLLLKAGAHELIVTKEGFRSFNRLFPVSAQEDSGFKILMTRDDPPPIVKVSDPPVVVIVAESPEVVPLPVPRPSTVRTPRPPRPDPALRSTPDRPPTVAYRPVPDGPPDEKESLHTLLQEPDTFADRIVVPTGLYVLGPITMSNPDGTAATTVCRVALHAKTNNIAHLEPTESPVEVQIAPDLAAHLRSLADPRSLQSRTHLIGRWGQTAAVLTFHVQKRNDSETAAAVPILKKIEFLVGMNFYRIGEGNYKDSFKTITATASNAPFQGVSDRHDWSIRLTPRYTNQLKKVVNVIKENKFYHNMQVLNNAMAPAFDSMIRNSVTTPPIINPQSVPFRIR